MAFRRFFTITLILSSTLFTLAACNTMEGVGQDVQKAGQWIEKKSK